LQSNNNSIVIPNFQLGGFEDAFLFALGFHWTASHPSKREACHMSPDTDFTIPPDGRLRRVKLNCVSEYVILTDRFIFYESEDDPI